jgi:hypothetical protein
MWFRVGDEVIGLNGAPLSTMTDQELRYWLDTGVRFSLALQRRADPVGIVAHSMCEALSCQPTHLLSFSFLQSSPACLL